MKSDDFENVIRGLAGGNAVQQIARKAGISRGHAHRLLAGEVRRPSHETVVRLQSVQRSLGTPAAAGKVGRVTRSSGEVRDARPRRPSAVSRAGRPRKPLPLVGQGFPPLAADPRFPAW